MPQIQCPQCGYSALEVATRCPRCGEPFESRFWQHSSTGSRRRRIPAGLIIAGALVLVVVISAIQGELRVAVKPSPPRPPVIAADSALPSVTAADRALPPRTRPPSHPVRPPADKATASPPIALATDFGSAERRYASTWVNVRARPSNKAPVVLILKPGAPVMVDSLSRGWYRVVADGRRLGYVDQSLVGRAPKSASR